MNYDQLPENFVEIVEKETGLNIVGFNNYYTLSFDVQLDAEKPLPAIDRAQRKLEDFVNKHFEQFNNV
jgi:hypothetical protein